MVFNLNTGAPKRLPLLHSAFPEDAGIAACEGLTLRVAIEKHGSPKEYGYQWYLDGAPVSGATGDTFFWQTEKTDGGTHLIYCSVTNKAGTVNSRSAVVTVEDAAFRVPEFGYTGTYEVADGAGNAITPGALADDWNIRFLTTGRLTFTKLNGAAAGIDAFLVGGGGKGGSGYVSNKGYDPDWDATKWNGYGGGGGGGGYRTTAKGVTAELGSYDIEIGGQSGITSAFGYSASGGSAGGNASGSSGGSGGTGGSSGGSGSTLSWGGANGSDGGYAFEEASGTRYGAGGGGGGGCDSDWSYGSGGAGGKDGAGSSGAAALPNSGGGGGGGTGVGYPEGTSRVSDGGAGGSGIVIIRSKR